MQQLPSPPPPPRTDSLTAISGINNPDSLITVVGQDVDDAKRVLDSYSAEEPQLKQALGRMISRVQEMSSQLAAAFKFQSDLETQLTLTKSNLQLSLANTEMLEEALKRDPHQGRDVGWRRWSSRENQRHSEEQSREMPQHGLSRVNSLSSDGTKSPNPPVSPANAISPPPQASATPETRFFKFRFRGSSRSPSLSHSTHSTVTSLQNSPADASHLTSASLPSLALPHEIEADSTKREAELRTQLERQQKKYEILAGQKADLEAELESLSQALFEEANKMVATERIKLAETDDELRSTIQEKEALRSALRLIEKENDRLRQARAEQDISSEENTQRTLLSPPSVKEEKDACISPEVDQPSTTRSTDSQGAAGNADRQVKQVTVENNSSEGTVTSLADSMTISQLSTIQPESSPQSQPPQSQPDNPWSTFFRHNSGSGIVTSLG